MGQTCSIRPKVRRTDGQLVDSELGLDLIEATGGNVNEGWHLYKKVKSNDVLLALEAGETIELDRNGEPTLPSLMDVVDLGDHITTESISEMLERRLNSATDNTEQSKRAEVETFNSGSPYSRNYIAGLERGSGGELRIGVKSRSREEDVRAVLETNASIKLNDRLKVLLEKAGVGVGVLTHLEERMDIDGVTDFSGMKTIANGLVQLIRLRQNDAGARALPEEFSHLAIEMMKDDSLVKRLINSLNDESKLREVLGKKYDDYLSEYEGDMDLMAEEAAGKLLAEALIGNELLGKRQPRSLLERIWQAIKDFLGRFDLDGFVAARDEAENYASRLASDILTERRRMILNPEAIVRRDRMYSLTLSAKLDYEEVSEKISQILMKRATIAKRLFDEKASRDQKSILAELEGSRMAGDALIGIMAYLRQSYSEMESLLDMIRNKDKLEAMDNNRRADILREIKLIVDSIQHASPYVMDVIQDVSKWSDKEQEAWCDDNEEEDIAHLSEYMSEMFNGMVGISKILEYEYKKESEEVFKATIQEFLGERGRELIVDGKPELVTAHNIMDVVKKDVGVLSRWLDSANDTNNVILNILDQIVKAKRQDAREYMLEKRKEIIAIGLEAEKEGLRDFGFMYQRDERGRKTGDYVMEVDWAKVRKAKQDKMDELNKVFPNSPAMRRREYKAWLDTKSSFNRATGEFTIDLNKAPEFRSAEYQRLTPLQKKYAEKFYAIKREFDDMLPNGIAQKGSTIKILKDDLERLGNVRSVGDAIEMLKSMAKDRLMTRSDDSEYGSETILLDYDGKKINTVRTRFTHLDANDSEDDVSEDIVSSLVAYGAMASDFATMNDIVSELENARDYVKSSFHPHMTRGDKKMQEKFNVGSFESTDAATKEVSVLAERLDDFMEMQVYGNMHKDEGTVGKTNISKGKLADTVNWYTSLCTYAVNLLSGISNIATGICMMNIEAFCQEHFKAGDLIKADGIYAKEMIGYVSEIGNRQRSNKLFLFDELMNVGQDYESYMKDTQFDRKNWITQLLGRSPLFLLNTCGEHWMSNRTALAKALSIKLKDARGETTTLWDALVVVENEKGNPSAGAHLEIRQGVKKLNGEEFTRNDLFKVGLHIKAINESMHGIYNEEDRNAIQQYGIGRMAIMFRKWIVPSLKRRFASRKINMDLGMEQEGYYRTVWNFVMACANDVKNGSFSVAANWKKLSDHQKRNFARAAIEVIQYALIVAAIGLMGGAGDDKKGSWWYQMARYQLFRLKTELGVLIPLPTTMPFEAFRILKSPAAAVQTGQHVFELVKLLNPFNYEMVGGEDAVIRSGGYKDWSKAEKYAAQSLPLFGPLHNATNVEDMIQFFSNQ